MAFFIPSPDMGAKVKANLEKYTSKIPKSPDVLSDVQVWHRFQANPDRAVDAVRPEKRTAFLAEMGRLGAKYSRPGGKDDGTNE
jgi:hypothetical protein